MIDSSHHQLQLLVERAVRSVRASTGRKMQMREELLAHATCIFEEELARHLDEQLALQNTTRRFGDPKDLGIQLQDAVPRTSLLYSHLEAWWGCSPALSCHRGVIRFATRVGLATAAAILLAFVPVMLMKERVAQLGIAFAFSIAIAVGLFLFSLITISFWMLDALRQRNWQQILVIAALSALLSPGINLGLCAAISADLAWSFQNAFSQLLPSILLMPIAVICMAFGLDHELRLQEEWARLSLDE
jgi:hypothetical protein